MEENRELFTKENQNSRVYKGVSFIKQSEEIEIECSHGAEIFSLFLNREETLELINALSKASSES